MISHIIILFTLLLFNTIDPFDDSNDARCCSMRAPSGVRGGKCGEGNAASPEGNAP